MKNARINKYIVASNTQPPLIPQNHIIWILEKTNDGHLKGKKWKSYSSYKVLKNINTETLQVAF